MGKLVDENGILKKVGKFLLEILLASILFVAVALPAVGLSEFVKYLQGRGVDAIITTGLQIVEFAIFTIDLILILVYLTRTAIDLGKDIWNR